MCIPVEGWQWGISVSLYSALFDLLVKYFSFYLYKLFICFIFFVFFKPLYFKYFWPGLGDQGFRVHFNKRRLGTFFFYTAGSTD